MANEIIKDYNDCGRINTIAFTSALVAVGNNVSGSGGSTQGAIRFTSINIPKNSSINMAHLFLPYASVGSTGTWKWKLTGIDEDNTAVIDSGTWGRSRTTAEVNFNEGEPTSGGTKTINVKSILEEITSRGGWSSGNALGFTMTDEGSDVDVWALFNQFNAYLVYRLTAEPNFTPTPVSVSAPTIPSQNDDFGIKISIPGQSVFTATDAQTYFTTYKKQFKVIAEGQETLAGTTTTITHSSGYIPFAIVYYQAPSSSVWRKLYYFGQGTGNYYYLTTSSMVLNFESTGYKVYYYIFIDELTS